MTTALKSTMEPSHLTPLPNSRESKSTLQPTKSPYFPPRASDPNPVQIRSKWQAREKQLVVSLLTAGKDYGEISQQLPGRSESACKSQIYRIFKSQPQESNSQDDEDLEEVKDSRGSGKRWEDWEDQVVTINYSAGKTRQEISRLLPSRSTSSIKSRCLQHLRPRLQETFTSNPQITNRTLKKWTQWEDQLVVTNQIRGKSWREISRLLPSRTASSIEKRWRRRLRPHLQETFRSDPQITDRTSSRGTQQEDQGAVTNKIAGKSWQEINGLLPSRTAESVAPRVMKIKPRLQTGSTPLPTFQLPKLQIPILQSKFESMSGERWSQWEDHLLVSLRTAGKSWVEITQSIPNRSVDALKGRVRYAYRCLDNKNSWTELEKEILVSLVNAIGPRWQDIEKEMPGRTAKACILQYEWCRGEGYKTGGPSPADWKNYWDSESLAHRLQTKLTVLDAPDPEEAEMDAVEPEFAGRDANEDVRLGAGESTSAPVSAVTTLKEDSRTFNAKKRRAIHVPMV